MIGRMFVDALFEADSKQIAEEILIFVKRAFEAGLGEIQWMSDETKVKAKSKSQRVMQKIGYPQWITNLANLTKHYEHTDAQPTGADYFNNVVRSNEFDQKEMERDLDKPVDKAKWEMFPSEVNAYYNPSNNEIVFPAGMH